MTSVTLPATVEAYIGTRTTEDGTSTQSGTEEPSPLSGQITFRTISPVYSMEGQGVLMEPRTLIVMLNATGMAMLLVMVLLAITRAGMDQMEATVSTVATGEAAEIKFVMSVGVEHNPEQLELPECEYPGMSSA